MLEIQSDFSDSLVLFQLANRCYIFVGCGYRANTPVTIDILLEVIGKEDVRNGFSTG